MFYTAIWDPCTAKKTDPTLCSPIHPQEVLLHVQHWQHDNPTPTWRESQDERSTPCTRPTTNSSQLIATNTWYPSPCPLDKATPSHSITSPQEQTIIRALTHYPHTIPIWNSLSAEIGEAPHLAISKTGLVCYSIPNDNM